MSLTLATLIPALILIALGVPLLISHNGAGAALRAFPRSQMGAWIFFGAGAAWFLYNIWNLSPADFGDYRTLLFIGFALIAILAFKCVPDFLAVRGVCVLVLMGATPLLMADYMIFGRWQIIFLNVILYIFISLAIWLGAQPWRMRDFLDWLFARPQRSRMTGGLLAGCGILLAIAAFTY